MISPGVLKEDTQTDIGIRPPRSVRERAVAAVHPDAPHHRKAAATAPSAAPSRRWIRSRLIG